MATGRKYCDIDRRGNILPGLGHEEVYLMSKYRQKRWYSDGT